MSKRNQLEPEAERAVAEAQNEETNEADTGRPPRVRPRSGWREVMIEALNELRGDVLGLNDRIETVAERIPTVATVPNVPQTDARKKKKHDSESGSSESESSTDEDRGGPSKFKPVKPPNFVGSKDYKILDDWLYDIESYFEAASVRKSEKVACAKQFLKGEAKTWWRIVEGERGYKNS